MPDTTGTMEAFVKTFKRDYVDGAELRDAETVLTQLNAWFDDDNTRAPHSALGMRSPGEYHAWAGKAAAAVLEASLPSIATPHLVQDARSDGGPLSVYPPKIGFESASASR